MLKADRTVTELIDGMKYGNLYFVSKVAADVVYLRRLQHSKGCLYFKDAKTVVRRLCGFPVPAKPGDLVYRSHGNTERSPAPSLIKAEEAHISINQWIKD